MAGFQVDTRQYSRVSQISTRSWIITGQRLLVISEAPGTLHPNPTQERIRQSGAALPVDFLLNVTLNEKRKITGFFCGDVLAAHESGCNFAKETAMTPVKEPFPFVITTNSGYPLDQNLYQSVKGMVAAAEIVTDGGGILLTAECSDGFPDHGNFARLIFRTRFPPGDVRYRLPTRI